MDGAFGGLELGFLFGWLMTVGIRRFVYRQPLYRGAGFVNPPHARWRRRSTVGPG